MNTTPKRSIRGSNILITGGTGSFGKRVASHLIGQNPKTIKIFSRDEKKQEEMRRDYPDFKYILGDVRDPDSLEDAMRGVDIVFHAAALKHVPKCESWPMQAIMTNAIGSYNVCRSAARAGVGVVVSLSTDKAVEPVNVMGMTKALMEKITAHFRESDSVFCCVRYGNVVGSRGSIYPVFRSQIAKGGPVSITVPHMTRFMLSLDEAVGLVFYAMENADGGEVFVRKAPACTVGLFAQAMIELYGKGRDIPTVLTGMRVGEKIHEVLLNEYEMLRSHDRGDYFVVPAATEGEQIPTEASAKYVEYASHNTHQITDTASLRALLDGAEKSMEDGL